MIWFWIELDKFEKLKKIIKLCIMFNNLENFGIFLYWIFFEFWLIYILEPFGILLVITGTLFVICAGVF